MTNLRVQAVRAADLAEAFAKTHITEDQGPNLSDQIVAWQHFAGGVAGESYCCDFTFSMYLKSWCVGNGLLTGADDHANRLVMLGRADDFARESKIPRTGSCQSCYDAAHGRGRTHDKHFQPSRGDQVFFDFPVHGVRLGRAHHTGIVLEILPDGTVRTAEANTPPGSSGNQSDGEGVYLKTRPRTYIWGFAHYE